MMEPVAISWLVASATSPLMAVLSLWTVYVFHTYRKRWRTVDLFLLAIASQELVSSVFIFGYAIVSLVNPEIPALCSFVQWGLVAIRTFQMATLSSMVVDRALTVRWPYRYRFSVRRNQIRYHVAVLALTSALVGVASVFAHNPSVQQPVSRQIGGICSSHPLQWDFKFVVFLLAFHGVLLLVSLVCTVHIEAHRCRNGGHEKGGPFQIPDCSSDLPVPTSVTSPLDTDSHTGSTKALHRPYRQSSRRPYFNKNSKGTVSVDFRWPPVAIVSLICFSINHLPYLVLSSLATAMPHLWSPWHEALLSWLRLAEAAIVPLVLCLVDKPLRSALKRTFQRRSGGLSPLAGDDGPFQMYFDKDHFRKRGAFGSVTPIGIITNYRRTPGKKRRSRGSSKCKYKLPGLQNGDSVLVSKKKAFLSGAEPLSKLSCADLTSLEVWREEDEYVSDPDGFSTFSGDSAVFHGDGDDIYDDKAKMCGEEDVYGGSFTTIANDDFEFHDTRPCGGEVRMKPGLPPPTPLDEQLPRFGSALRSKTSTGFYIKEKPFEIEERIPKAASTEKFCDLMNLTVPLFLDQHEDIKDPDIIRSSLDQKSPPPTLSKATSFSMNDLDLIDDNGSGDERIYVLPVKSESTLSLYRLRMETTGVMPEILLPITKSETNVNGDSGYGTQTNGFNPIWPAHRPPTLKISDPLASNRKRISSRQRSPDPMNLHPKMQRLPWISAWKKLGENGDSSGRNSNDSRHNTDKDKEVSHVDENFELRQKEPFQWKDSIVYSSNIHCYKEEEDGIVYTHIQPENFTSSDDVGGKKFDSKVVKKGSFKDCVQNIGSYGKIKNSGHKRENSMPDNMIEKNRPSENIYEEIIHGKPVINIRTPLKGKARNSECPTEEISYAQTDILNFNGNDAMAFPAKKNQDFTLNISIRPLPDVNSFNANEFPLSSESHGQNFNVSYTSGANLNVCDFEVGRNKPLIFGGENNWRNDNNALCRNSGTAVYDAQQRDIREFPKTDNIQFRISGDRQNAILGDVDSNSNSLENLNRVEKFCRNATRESITEYDRKVHQKDIAFGQRCRQANHKIRRRESAGRTRRSRSERIESSDDQQVTKPESFYAVAEKDEGGKGSSSSSPKHRGSNSKKGRRQKRPRAESFSGQDSRKIRDEISAIFQNERGDGLWPKVSPSRRRHFSKTEPCRIEDRTEFVKAESNTECMGIDNNRKDVCLELAEVPSVVAVKDLYDRNNLWRRDSRSRDDKYRRENENNLNRSSRKPHRRRPLVRSEAVDLPEQQHVPLSNARVFGAADISKEISRLRTDRTDVDQPPRDNRITRNRNNNSSGRMLRRSSVDLEPLGEQEKSKRIRRSESDQRRNANKEKRKTSNDAAVANGNFMHVLETEDFVNRNIESNDQQQQQEIMKRCEMSMDYLVYGHQRDNEPENPDSSEIFPFEMPKQPLHYRRNKVKERHGVEKQSTREDAREEQRCKQKKIAVTDFL